MNRCATLFAILLSLMLSCKGGPESRSIEPDHVPKELNRPKVSFTFDDGITQDILNYPFKQWNQMILSSLDKAGVKSVFFVTGANKSDSKGKYLLQSWNDKGHSIANHTFSHPNFHSEDLSIKDFEKELLDTDTIISGYNNYQKLFRFPYLKEGASREKIDGIRNVLSQYGYRNGYVTIDASDWYINGRLIRKIKKLGIDKAEVPKFKEYYLEHIMDRANYYETLSYELTGRHINHTLLLHHNLTSTLFLGDLIARFKEEGWEIIDAPTAFKDKIFETLPSRVPAGESLIWSMAKESGKYENSLRYPAEDGGYEESRMDSLGL
ncbi:polysaccharide deacetylase family protein [Ulvibacterium sp.]|uniref:polysaccharide deacetylase family protein n=1 Tax=Ulvibacterium sp. TaxID=2665914 RepID=UPI003BA9D7E5